jgi:hypothetical protein
MRLDPSLRHGHGKLSPLYLWGGLWNLRFSQQRPEGHRFSRIVIVFHERLQKSLFFPAGQRFSRQPAPGACLAAGYAALIEAHGLKVPLPRVLAAVSSRNKSSAWPEWRILPARYAPQASLEGLLGTIEVHANLPSMFYAPDWPRTSGAFPGSI